MGESLVQSTKVVGQHQSVPIHSKIEKGSKDEAITTPPKPLSHVQGKSKSKCGRLVL